MLENYEKLGKLGDGAQGSVYKVRHRTTKKTFALKMIRCRDSAQANLALKEVKVLIQLRHPSIVSYTDFFLDFDTRNPKEMLVCLVMELCEEMHLEKLIKLTRSEMMMSGKHPIAEGVILTWILQAATALQYIHDKGFMHRDLKPSNIFFASEEDGGAAAAAGKGAPSAGAAATSYSTNYLGGIVADNNPSQSNSIFTQPRLLKLGDFGLATAAQANGDLNKSTVGTPYYFAPEQMLRQKYDNKVDIWGLGAVMLELICLRDRPINSEVLERPEISETVVNDICRIGFSKGLAVIVRDMLNRYPAARPSPGLIVQRVKALMAFQQGGAGVPEPLSSATNATAVLGARRASAVHSRATSAASSRNNSHNTSDAGDNNNNNDAAAATCVLTPLEAGRLCEMCQAKPSKLLCRECEETLCADCDAIHHRIPSRENHRRTEIEVSTPLYLAASGVGFDAQLSLLQTANMPCQMCEARAAVVLCPACESEAYCKQCDELKHINPKRRLHERIVIRSATSQAAAAAAGPQSRKNSPTCDPLAATITLATGGGGRAPQQLNLDGRQLGAASIINTTTILAAPTVGSARAVPRPNTASNGVANSMRRPSGILLPTPSTQPLTASGDPIPNGTEQTPTAEPLPALLERQRSAASLAASTIHPGGINSADTTTITTANGFIGALPSGRKSTSPTMNSDANGGGLPLIATLYNNGIVPTANSTNPHLMPKAPVAKRPAGSGAAIDPAFIDKYLAATGNAASITTKPISVVVPSPECPSLEEAVAIVEAAWRKRGCPSQSVWAASGQKNDRIVVREDVYVENPIILNFPVHIVGIIGGPNNNMNLRERDLAGETPTVIFNCTPAFLLASIGGVVSATNASSSSSAQEGGTSSSSNKSGPSSPTAAQQSSASQFCCSLSNLNIRHDCEEVPKTVNRAKVSAIVIEGGQWRIERCRLSSASGHGIIAEGPETVARVVECAVLSTKLCGLMLLNGTSGEVTLTHIVDSKQTGILVRKGATTRIRKNQIKQNGETGVYVVDAKPLIEENEISNNLGCGVVVKGEHAAPLVRENTITSNTQAGIFYCDGAKGTASDNVISESQRAGILIKTNANPTITRNIVRKSKETGIYCFEGGRGTITHNTICDNLNAGILVTTLANITATHNRIHKNYYEALWVCKKGEGTFQNNDLRSNRKGPKDIEEGSLVVMAGNLES